MIKPAEILNLINTRSTQIVAKLIRYITRPEKYKFRMSHLFVFLSLTPLIWAPIKTEQGSLFIFTSAIFACLLLGYIFYSISRIVHFLRFERSIESRAGFIFVMSFILALLILEWPGFASSDDLFLLSAIFRGEPSGWLSFTYSLFTQASTILFFNEPIRMAIVNFVLFANWVAVVLSLTRWSWRNPIYWLLLLLLITPRSYLLVIFLNRDSTFTILILTFLFGLLQKCTAPKAIFQIRTWEFLLLGLILGDLRQDGKIITLLTPLFIYLMVRRDKKWLIRHIFITAIASLGLFWGGPKIFNYSSYSFLYRATALISPVSFIINKIGVEQLTADQRLKISRFIRPEDLVIDYNPDNITAIRKAYGPVLKENYLAFQEASFDLIRTHFDLYLMNRSYFFSKIFNFVNHSDMYADHLRPGLYREENYGLGRKHYKYEIKPDERTALQKVHQKWLALFSHQMPAKLERVLYSGAVPLTVIFIFSFLYFKYFAYAILAWLLFARAIVVTLLAPAPYTKYVTSVWYGGWVLFLIFMAVEGGPLLKKLWLSKLVRRSRRRLVKE